MAFFAAWAAAVLGVGPAATFTNPVLDRKFPDPGVVRAANGTFFAFGTGDRIQVAASENLVDWRSLGPALGTGTNTKWGDGRTFWAPDVTRHTWNAGETTFVMYYAGVQSDERRNHCIGVALSRTPEGPYTDVGAPLICRPGYIAIDPKRVDVNGQAHLFWGSGHGGSIFVSPLEPRSWGLLASPNLEPALTFLFDGCCRGDGASSSTEMGPLSAAACAGRCAENDTCTAIELDGCLESTQCGKNCFHYHGTPGGTILDGDCRLDGDMKCYQKAAQITETFSSHQRALLGSDSDSGATDATVVIHSNLQSEYEKTVEGAWVDFDANAPGGAAWFIYYSGSNCCTDKALYGVSVARAPADSPTGPFTKKAPPTLDSGSAILASTFNGTEAGPWQAPGHNSIVRDDDGQAWMLFHAFPGDNRTERVLMLQKVEYRDGWPWVGQPAAGPQQAPNIHS